MKTQLDKIRRDGWCGFETSAHSISQHDPLLEATAQSTLGIEPEASKYLYYVSLGIGRELSGIGCERGHVGPSRVLPAFIVLPIIKSSMSKVSKLINAMNAVSKAMQIRWLALDLVESQICLKDPRTGSHFVCNTCRSRPTWLRSGAVMEWK